MCAIDLFKDQINYIDIPSQPKENLDEWKTKVTNILTPILNENCILVVASPPTNIKRQKGLVCTIILQPGSMPKVFTQHLTYSNHHELTLAGLIDNLPTALTITGDVTILLHNQAAIYTLFNERNTLNAYYHHEFNNTIHLWLTNTNNQLFLGWLPAGIPLPIIQPYILKLGKQRQQGTPPMYYTLATSWCLAKEQARRGKLRFITAAKNNPKLLSRLTYTLTGHGPTGRYYAH
ncbi:hypothetical protein AX15_007581 [Amanita polypyramis BW_CC]|nr:hypothetical protein AX15_007581 [Amanita polypyramis BW_CC]